MPRTGRPKLSVDVEHECEQCGVHFSAPSWTNISGRFCSRSCYYSSKRGQPNPAARKERIEFACQQCGKGFTCRYNSMARKFCSRACRDEARKAKTETIDCAGCGEAFVREASMRRIFCSPKCRGSVMKGTKASNFKGGYLQMSGYQWITVPEEERAEHPHLKSGRYMQEHVYKAEKALGRCLRFPHEVVHHVNCNKLDNRNGNLLICSQEYHRYLHGEMSRRWAQEHLAAGMVTGPRPQ